MEIAILVDELPVSSAPKIVGEEAFHLERLGVKCDVYVLKHRSNEFSPAHAQSISLIHLDENLGALGKIWGWRVPSFSFFSLYHIAYPYLLSGKVDRKLDQYDAVIAHFSAAIFLLRLHLQKAKMAYYCWDPVSYIFNSAYLGKWSKTKRKLLSFVATFLDKELLSKPDVVILPSKFHLNRIRKLGIGKPVEIIYPGTEVAEKIPRERGDYVLSVARWEIGKNPFLLLDVAERIRREAKILMVGPWRPYSLLKEFQREAKKKGVLRKFKIVGPKCGSDLKDLYLRARCLLHPKIEAFGFTGLEASAHGCPMIFPQGSGVTELFTHGIQGYFPNQGDVDEYAEYMDELLSGEGLAWKMGCEAWNVAKNYTWEEHAKKLANGLKEII